MKRIFADSVYWIAVINPADQWFESVHAAASVIQEGVIVTTHEILIETLNFYAEKGEKKRDAISDLVRSILLDVRIEKIPATEENFLDGLDLYERRRDKGYSLTDCISMNICRKYKIKDVLTHDDHFRQEGFNELL